MVLLARSNGRPPRGVTGSFSDPSRKIVSHCPDIDISRRLSVAVEAQGDRAQKCDDKQDNSVRALVSHACSSSLKRAACNPHSQALPPKWRRKAIDPMPPIYPTKAPIRPSIGSWAMCTERLFTQESSPKRERLMNWISVVRGRGRLRGPLLADAVANRELRVSDGVGAQTDGEGGADRGRTNRSMISLFRPSVPLASLLEEAEEGRGTEEVGGRWRDKTGRR